MLKTFVGAHPMYMPGLGVMYANVFDVHPLVEPCNKKMVPTLDTRSQKLLVHSNVTKRDVKRMQLDACIVSPLHMEGSMFLAGDMIVHRMGRFCRTPVDDMLRGDKLVSYIRPGEGEHECVQTESGHTVWVVEVESWHKTLLRDAVVTEFDGTAGTVVNEAGFFVPSNLPNE